ncbi:MAG: TIGR04076 family protein [Candidatus Bathyarchaeota archaeon]|jgi:uncharacterized repeat protein (TIGR04076 family)|nr:MAG: TIGR04076 family protein [Candidatus Bathyarchaeota archaeon]
MTGKEEVRITVLRKLASKEIFGGKPPLGQTIEACPVFKVGQQFVVDEGGEMPRGFCHWAWNDLYKVVTALRYGANWETGAKEKGAPTVHCCTDGLRPVIFKLERA